MPYKLRKAPKRELYWVIAEDGTKKSKEPIPLARAKAQMRALYASMKGGGFQFKKEGGEYVIFDEESGQIIKRLNTLGETLQLIRKYTKEGLPKIQKVYEPMEGEQEEVNEGAEVSAGGDQQYRVQLKALLNALAPRGVINQQSLFDNLRPFLDQSNSGHAFLIRLFPYLMKVRSDAPLHKLVELIGRLVPDINYYIKTPINKQKAYVEFMSGSGKVTQKYLNKLIKDQRAVARKIRSVTKKLIGYMNTNGLTNPSQIPHSNKLLLLREDLIDESERISAEFAKWEAIESNDGDFIEEEDEEDEDEELNGGMYRSNIPAPPTTSLPNLRATNPIYRPSPTRQVTNPMRDIPIDDYSPPQPPPSSTRRPPPVNRAARLAEIRAQDERIEQLQQRARATQAEAERLARAPVQTVNPVAQATGTLPAAPAARSPSPEFSSTGCLGTFCVATGLATLPTWIHIATVAGQGKPKKCKKCKLHKLRGGFSLEQIKGILRRAIRYIYSQGNNIAYFSAILASVGIVEQIAHNIMPRDAVEWVLKKIFPEWFSRLLIVLGASASIHVIGILLIEELRNETPNPELEDPTAIIKPPEPSWLQRILGRNDNPKPHQD